MERRFFSRGEVASFLGVKVKTLANYGCRYPVYKAGRAGVYHVAHVRILEKVHADALTPDEGLALWETEKRRMAGKIRVRHHSSS